ncbi:DUF4142 domain-containing protein [Pedobacter agri]|uniref:DUF4142 domain-containing protein n=1 Tax=Pedobacter agri TaxID=454586 RepID=UPI002931F5F6|nr:DUF4142 domain-containing protein [Pedobacter agri]
MKNIKTAFAILLTISLGNNLYAHDILGDMPRQPESGMIQEVLPPEVFMNQALLYGLKATQMSGIAAQNGSQKVKGFAQTILDAHAQANTELLALAKSKNITLTASKNEEGQRPDGRVDSAPTTLQDTSRNQNQGEAGNTGQPKGVMLNGFAMLRNADLQQSVNKLKDVKGQDFDQAYITSSIQDHQNLIVLFEAGSKSTDAAVKKYAKKYLPKFKTHLTQLNAMLKAK